ncbi:CPBP family intramembrane glutamic endopeptidase [Alkalihalobacillus sp. AL-G]|uniref:CPBP family intramembrane glutamic endopeptidase n=1 Tax=Alkalihalobacillus sp. AL-G TaxID=2926399 RepID=UPI00272DA25C|nr:CPBP family intramembrane glutamic endopeptidase [Alkalihalobacillus sp. AL-G]WLD93866.1 CPBP family intramembrane metalloprotease [Alkalihalobacillus sp. AL-G]
MKNLFLLLLGPTLMIFIGLQLLENVLITFILFYSWLLLVPLISKGFTIGELVSKDPQRSIRYGILSGGVFFLFIFGGLYWLHPYFIDVEHLQKLLTEWGFSGNGVFGLILVLLIVNPILEEVYWRGFMYTRLKEKVKPIHAIWIASACYTLYHFLSVIPMFQWPLNAIAVLPVFIAGLFWGYMREKTGSIIGTVISHALGDLGIMCVYWFFVK